MCLTILPARVCGLREGQKWELPPLDGECLSFPLGMLGSEPCSSAIFQALPHPTPFFPSGERVTLCGTSWTLTWQSSCLRLFSAGVRDVDPRLCLVFLRAHGVRGLPEAGPALYRCATARPSFRFEPGFGEFAPGDPEPGSGPRLVFSAPTLTQMRRLFV